MNKDNAEKIRDEIEGKLLNEVENINKALFEALNKKLKELKSLNYTDSDLVMMSYYSVFSFCASMFHIYINRIKCCEKEKVLELLRQHIDLHENSRGK